MRARGLRHAVSAAIATALLCAAPAPAQTLGELAPFAHPDGCVAGRTFENGKPGPTGIQSCRTMKRQHSIAALAAAPDASRLYAVDLQSESVVAYRTLASGGVRELSGDGSCAPLSGARVSCALTRGRSDEREGGATAVSPDGRFLYVASRVGPGDPAVTQRTTVIDVFTTDGGLARVGCVSSDGTDGRGAACSPARGLTQPAQLVMSPDGRWLYVRSTGYAVPATTPPPDEGIASFRRDPASGALVQPEGPAGCTTREGAGGACGADPALESLRDLAIAPSGEVAYITAGGGKDARGGVAVLRRDPATGTLEFARGPGTCLGTLTGRADCTPDPDLNYAASVSVAPDGRILYVSADLVMVPLAANETAATVERRGCIANGYPKKCARLATDPSAGARLLFAPDGRSALLSDGSDLESIARDPDTGALTSRGCLAYEKDDEYDPCGAPPFPHVATANPVLASNGIVYAGEDRSIYTLAPGAAAQPPSSVRLKRGRVLVPVRCHAAATCRGTLELEPWDEYFGIPPARLSVPAGRTRNVTVRVPAAIQRAIGRHRDIEFLATTRIALGGRQGLASSRPVRVKAPGRSPRVTCRSGGVRTLARTSRFRVYTVRTPAYDEVYETTYACLFAAGRQIRLDEPDLWTAYGPFELVGPLLAYDHELAAEGESDAASFVRVIDLRNGRELRELCAAGPEGCAFESSDSDVHTIVMLPSGGVAWTASSGGDHWVVKADAGGKPRVLDEAQGRIRLGSLRLSGNRITWKRGNSTRSAPLR